MQSIREIKNRIKSIESTKQITETMKIVSTAKIRTARRKVEGSRPFFEATRDSTFHAANNVSDSNHNYIKAKDVKNSLYIVVGSDRGLCGGYNINVSRKAEKEMASAENPKVISIGIRIRDYFRRRRNESLIRAYHDISENPNYEDARDIGEYIMELFDKGEVDEVYLVYTKMISMLELEPTIVKLLPLELSGEEKEQYKSGEITRFLPDEETYISQAIPKYVYTSLYGAMVEASAAEHSARLTSMDAAVKNAEGLIDDLRLTYNKVRQTNITQEITEIIGGADSVK